MRCQSPSRQASAEEAQYGADQRQLGVELFGRVPIIAVIADLAVGGQFDERSTVNGQQSARPPAPDAESKIPNEERALAVGDGFGNYKAAIVELLEHMRIDARDCVDASHLVEWIAEIGVGRVDLADTRNVARHDVLEECDDARQCAGVGHSPVALRISAKYQRYGRMRKHLSCRVNAFGKSISNSPARRPATIAVAASSAVIRCGMRNSFRSVSGVLTKPGLMR